MSENAAVIPPRKVVFDDVQFVQPSALSTFTAIDMVWFTAASLTTSTCAVTTLDQVFVENYDGVSGDDFQVFYTQQAANFVVPQTILNSDGTTRLAGAPVAGLTNAQAWAEYGVAVAGEVAPSDAGTMDNIVGLVAPD